VGHYGIHTAGEYEQAPKIKYFVCEEGSCISVGRYGPFRTKDRKPDDLMVQKAFLFRQAPLEYSFGVSEQLHHQVQLIDITSDATGEPHDIARANIAMYVNETGHNKHLQQNVFSKEAYDRSVNYYYKPSEKMERGKPFELLTNYKSACYESKYSTRTRQVSLFILVHSVSTYFIVWTQIYSHSRATGLRAAQSYGRPQIGR